LVPVIARAGDMSVANAASASARLAIDLFMK
jgi:hypothetical protein